MDYHDDPVFQLKMMDTILDRDLYPAVSLMVEYLDRAVIGGFNDEELGEWADTAAKAFAKFLGTNDEIVVMECINTEINQRMDSSDHHFNKKEAFQEIEERLDGIRMLADFYYHDTKRGQDT